MTQPAGAVQSEGTLPGGKTVLVELEDGIAWVAMNRPDKRNCISPTLASEMLAVLNALEADRRCQVVVLTGSGRFVLRRHGPEGILPRQRPSLAARARAYLSHQRGVAVAPVPVLSEADHRDGQRLVLRRRVHAARLVRSGDRRRGGDVRSVGDQLGHHPGRRRHQGGVAGDEPARLSLLHHDRRDLRRPQGRRHGAGQRGGAAEGFARAHAGRSRRP